MSRTSLILKGAAGALFCFGAFWGCASPRTAPKSQGWGVDACLTAHVDAPERAAYLPQLRAAGITFLRERGPVPGLAEERAAGFRVVSFLGLGPLNATQPGDALPEDLLAVFNAAKSMQQTFGGEVDAWEIGGEPDVGYCTDLPDRYVAFEKTVYLGIRAAGINSLQEATKGTEVGKSQGSRPGTRGVEPPGTAKLNQPSVLQESAESAEEGTSALLPLRPPVKNEIGGDGAEKGESGKAGKRETAAEVGDCGGGPPASGDPTKKDGRREPEKLGAKIGNRKAESGSSNATCARSASAPVVLMGALALPPGPWLERAARNGLFDYTDACNFHFYGNADDLSGVIRAHEAFAVKAGSRGSVRDRSAGFPACSPANRELSSSPSTLSANAYSFPLNAYRYLLSAYRRVLSAFSLQSSAFPLWITECGINAVPPEDFFNPDRRKLQAEFTVATARQALEARNVAVFMPFILVHDKDPHSLTLAPDWPLAAWTAYSDFTRKHPFPSRVLALPPRDPNPVVVQWLPDNRTTIPHKVSGSYRFRNGQPIRGVLRIYNFSDEAVAGRLEATALAHVSVVGGYLGSAGLTVPPMGSIEIPVSFAPKSPGYFREYCQVEFVDDCGRRSPLYFGLEVTPRERDFVAVPVKPGLVKHGKIGHPMFHEFTVTSSSGVWTGINGLMVEEESAEKQGKTEEGRAGTLKAESGKSEKREPTGQSFLQEATEGTERLPASLETVAPVCDRRTEIALKAWVTKAENDPLLPTMAVAGIKGLPPHGFLRLRLDQPVDSGFRVRVDLVDRKGQRFTIWENLGANYYGPGDDVWLNLEDFHVYFWGRCSDRPVFHPEAVEEIQLRFYIARPNDPRTVKLTLMEPRNGV